MAKYNKYWANYIKTLIDVLNNFAVLIVVESL